MFQPRISIKSRYSQHRATPRRGYLPYPNIAASNSNGAAGSQVSSGISPDLIESQERTRPLERDLMALKTRVIDPMRVSASDDSPQTPQSPPASSRNPDLDAIVPPCSRPCGCAKCGESTDQSHQEDVHQPARCTVQHVPDRRPQVLVSNKDTLASAWERKSTELLEEQEVEMMHDLLVIRVRGMKAIKSIGQASV
ncbi:hypothetical protein FRC12_022112 [Ceratobasidium sp. 428]|nr:hypothetical protein FRC12_022112 [Ceratobasidium sp. 428]